MSQHVLIAPDKFKGTLTAQAAARAIARGWKKVRPKDSLQCLPITDGGDGFGEVMGRLLGAKVRWTRTVDAAYRPVRARWWWEPKSRTAIIESAEVIGLAKHRGFHPFELDTFGLGAVIRAAAGKGARRCLIGIGGSATNDGGFGVARALGWKFLEAQGGLITSWTQLHTLAELVRPRKQRWFEELIVAVDVRNLLLGARGATRIFGPQKGLTRRDFKFAEAALRRLATVARQNLKRDCSVEPGAGAAGGLGFGLRAFARAQLRPGFDLFARAAELDKQLRWADLVITGEGAMDESTFMGKGAGQMGRRASRAGVPCLALAGVVQVRPKKWFVAAYGLTDMTTAKSAMKNPARWLERLAKAASRRHFVFQPPARTGFASGTGISHKKICKGEIRVLDGRKADRPVSSGRVVAQSTTTKSSGANMKAIKLIPPALRVLLFTAALALAGRVAAQEYTLSVVLSGPKDIYRGYCLKNQTSFTITSSPAPDENLQVLLYIGGPGTAFPDSDPCDAQAPRDFTVSTNASTVPANNVFSVIIPAGHSSVTVTVTAKSQAAPAGCENGYQTLLCAIPPGTDYTGSRYLVSDTAGSTSANVHPYTPPITLSVTPTGYPSYLHKGTTNGVAFTITASSAPPVDMLVVFFAGGDGTAFDSSDPCLAKYNSDFTLTGATTAPFPNGFNFTMPAGQTTRTITFYPLGSGTSCDSGYETLLITLPSFTCAYTPSTSAWQASGAIYPSP